MEQAIQKSDVLIEALPYIQSFRNKIVVIKLGGSAMKERNVMDGVLQDIVFLKAVGMEPILVHGGGPYINKELAKVKKQTPFIDGYRVTDKETLEIVKNVSTNISRSIVETINKNGSNAVCVCDLEVSPIRAEKFILPEKPNNSGIDAANSRELGFVGQIANVDPLVLTSLCKNNTIPVIPPIAKGKGDQMFNVNADSVASFIAKVLIPEKLVLLSDTHGIMTNPDDKDSFASTLHEDEINSLINKNVITSGMLPKVNACITALNSGVKKAHIIDGRIPHSILLEIFTDKGIGTQILV